MPMRFEITAPETRSEKTTRMTGEIGALVAFCLTGFTLTMLVAAHMSTQFLAG